MRHVKLHVGAETERCRLPHLGLAVGSRELYRLPKQERMGFL